MGWWYTLNFGKWRLHSVFYESVAVIYIRRWIQSVAFQLGFAASNKCFGINVNNWNTFVANNKNAQLLFHSYFTWNDKNLLSFVIKSLTSTINIIYGKNVFDGSDSWKKFILTVEWIKSQSNWQKRVLKFLLKMIVWYFRYGAEHLIDNHR